MKSGRRGFFGGMVSLFGLSFIGPAKGSTKPKPEFHSWTATYTNIHKEQMISNFKRAAKIMAFRQRIDQTCQVFGCVSRGIGELVSSGPFPNQHELHEVRFANYDKPVRFDTERDVDMTIAAIWSLLCMAEAEFWKTIDPHFDKSPSGGAA